MVAGPELATMTTEFEMCIKKVHEKSSVALHHDQTKSAQITFANHVKSLIDVMQDMRNPFMKEQKSVKAG